MAMQNYRLELSYDGSRYEGWQRQKRTENTIQGKVEAVLSRMTGTKVEVDGAGRTDAGVHAEGQVASVKLDTVLSETEICRYLNHYLPEDIAVQRVSLADMRFHARLNAVSKWYRYRIETGLPKHVFDRKYIWLYGEKLDTEVMQKAAAVLTGTHDFRSFCGNKNMKKSTIRTIEEIRITETENEVILDYTGDGFLQYMVRILTGTLVECGSGKRKPEEMYSILNACSREAAGITAPACGLTMMGVKYR